MRQIASCFSLGALALAALASGSRVDGEGFGRWETSLNSCLLEHRSATGLRLPNQDCQRLRLDQNIEGLLTARFLAPGQEMVFAGSLASGQRPMRCNNDGACKPQWPTQLIVQTAADAGLDRRGLPASMPSARLAQGHCEIQKRVIQCQALAADGEEWRAKSTL